MSSPNWLPQGFVGGPRYIVHLVCESFPKVIVYRRYFSYLTRFDIYFYLFILSIRQVFSKFSGNTPDSYIFFVSEIGILSFFNNSLLFNFSCHLVLLIANLCVFVVEFCINSLVELVSSNLRKVKDLLINYL